LAVLYKNKLLVLVSLVLHLKGVNAICQAKPDSLKTHTPEIGFKLQAGYTMSHHSQMQYLVQGHVKSYEIYYEKITSGRKNWHHAYRSPVVGYALNFTDFGNPVNMGYAISVIPYMKLHFVKRKCFEFNTRLGAGLAILTKSFDAVANNKNSAIASPLNASISINFEPEWKTKFFDIGLGLSFSHFSNGAYQTPNLGFNVPTLSLACGYKFNEQNPVLDKKKVFVEFKKQNSFELMLTGGAKEIMPAQGPKYFVGDVHVQFRRHYAVKSNLLLFGDVNYNRGYKRSYENWYDTTIANSTSLRAGLGIGYGLSFDRLMLLIHNGFYLYDKLNYDGRLYHRVAARYYFDNNVVVMFSLRTHFAKADVVELGIGYQFK
jgi:Lipid A 3-O-deacylase (PagL)